MRFVTLIKFVYSGLPSQILLAGGELLLLAGRLRSGHTVPLENARVRSDRRLLGLLLLLWILRMVDLLMAFLFHVFRQQRHIGLVLLR